MDVERRQEALGRFEQAAEVPLLVLAVAMLPLLLLPLLVELPQGVKSAFVAADWFIWVAFAVEYLVRLCLTPQRGRFVLREWASLLLVVLPFLRSLRVVRSARALRTLRLGRLVAVIFKASSVGRRLLVRHHLHYAVGVILVLVVASAGLALAVEEGAGGSIDSFGDALWWAATTVTTVGYGDMFPTTPAGRGIAVFLMVTGITLYGILTANLTAFFAERSGVIGREDEVLVRLDELLARMSELERRLAESGGGAQQS